MTTRKLNRLLTSGDIVECAACGELSAYAAQNVDDQVPHDPNTWACRGWTKGQVAHVGVACAWTWECGHCGATNCYPDSPILHPCYTHSED